MTATVALTVGGIALLCAPAWAEAPTSQVLSLDEYLRRVGSANLELVAQKFNVPIAEAQVAIAKIFPDPVLTAGASALNWTGAPVGVSVGVSQTIELGGKRGARIAVAEAGRAGAAADLESFFKTLRANATLAFIDSLHARLLLERKQQTLKSLERLASVNQERVRAGDIGEVPLIQSRVEAQRFRGELIAAEANVRSADLGLALQLGTPEPVLMTPSGDLRGNVRTFELVQLIARAREERPDVLSKKYALEASRSKVRLAHANRWIDLTLSLGWTHTTAASGAYGEIAPSPTFDALGASLSFPIPFSRIYRGELNAAVAGEAQADWALRATNLRVEIEVRQAFEKYKAAVDRVNLYTSGVLTDADQVLERTLYSYQRGAATLLEVLEAQRTDNEVHLAYSDAVADHARALVGLELAAGIWDIQF